MIQWTQAARNEFERYCNQTKVSVSSSGADATEVMDDLRRHIDEEVSASKLNVVTEEDVRRILTKIGAPEASHETRATAESPPSSLPPASIKKPGAWLFIFGVFLPIVTLLVEYFTGMCAATIFDPFPTVFHVFLVALVPLTNLAIWLRARQNDAKHRILLGWLNGISIGTALAYAILFLPLTPFALIGVIVYGFGLLPLSPLLSFIVAIRLRKYLRNLIPMPLKGLWTGMGIAALTFGILASPAILTQRGLTLAASGNPKEVDKGVRWLRAIGDEEMLLRACYGRNRNLYSLMPYVEPEVARTTYYRVTGKAFNSVPPPKLYAGRARWSVVEEEFTWDNDQGGDAVAGRVKGLSILSSRQDGIINADAATSYTEWTLEFKNVSGQQREARAQIQLPPGGVVSRLTLWVDGEEREAAFAGRGQVKEAYKAVVQQRRDPVLVTTCGPDRILMQCFPVPPNGGVMKVRIGITAPLALTKSDEGILRWPCFLERNFTIYEDFSHSVWMESPAQMEAAQSKLIREQTRNGGYGLRGTLTDPELGQGETIIRVKRNPEVHRVWTKDTRGEGEFIIEQNISEVAAESPSRVVFVIDGSYEMENFHSSIAEALARFSLGTEFAVMAAFDGTQEVYPVTKSDEKSLQSTAQALRKLKADGGHDNVPALNRAWDLAAQSSSGVVVWVHGPQPILLESAEALQQRFERRSDGPVLYEIQTSTGPNRVVEKFDGIPAVRSIPRLGKLTDDLTQLFASWQNKSLRQARRRLESTTDTQNGGKETDLHLARLWAKDEVYRLIAKRTSSPAVQLAGRYQLVTPVSGAVVLENKAQFDRAGLTPVDPTTVPSVPEPTTLAILFIAVIFLGVNLWRQKKRVAH